MIHFHDEYNENVRAAVEFFIQRNMTKLRLYVPRRCKCPVHIHVWDLYSSALCCDLSVSINRYRHSMRNYWVKCLKPSPQSSETVFLLYVAVRANHGINDLILFCSLSYIFFSFILKVAKGVVLKKVSYILKSILIDNIMDVLDEWPAVWQFHVSQNHVNVSVLGVHYKIVEKLSENGRQRSPFSNLSLKLCDSSISWKNAMYRRMWQTSRYSTMISYSNIIYSNLY